MEIPAIRQQKTLLFSRVSRCWRRSWHSGVIAVKAVDIMSFRGVKRRGNPLNRNENYSTTATNRISPHAYYRAENLRYQFKHGQELLPQFRKIICLVSALRAQMCKSQGSATKLPRAKHGNSCDTTAKNPTV